MTDDTEFEALRDQLRAATGAMGKMTSAIEGQNKGGGKNSRKADADRLESDMQRSKQKWLNNANDFNHATRGVTSSMSVLTGRTDVAAERMGEFARAIPGGAVLGSMVAWGKNTIDTWKQMSDVGQTFNGSMFDLAQAAAEAGQPLDEFAQTIKDNTKTVAVYGARNVTQLMKEVRQRTEANGMFGYTMEGINKVTGEYLESQRLYGNKAAVTNKKSIASSIDFAKQITAVAGATGQSREAIMAATMSAMRDVAMTSAMIGRSSDDVQAFSDATMKSVAILAGLPGVAGETFGAFLSQSVGFGTALFSDATATFIDGGLGQMVSSTDALAQAISNGSGDIEGATWQYLEDFKGQVEANREGLRVQAMSGNQSAKRILQMYSEVENITEAQYRQKKKEAEDTQALTAFLSSVGNIFKRLLSSLMTGVFGKLEDIESKMSSIFDSKAFIGLEGRFKGWGESIGAWMAAIDEKQVQAFANGIESAVGMFLGIANALAFLGQCITNITGLFSKLGGPIGTLVGLGAAFALIVNLPKMLGMAFMGIAKTFTGAKQKDMMIRASNVYVNGGNVGGGGGGGGLDDFGDGGGNERRPRRGNRPGRGGLTAAERLARRRGGRGVGRIAGSTLRRVADGAAGSGMLSSLFRGAGKGVAKAGEKGLFKMGAKGIGKSLLKKIPGVSILAGLGFGAQRALGGDFIGAGGELLSGLAGTIPGLGTAASVGIDAALMGRDMGAFGSAGRPGQGGGRQAGRRAGPRRGGMGGMLGKMALGGLGAGGLGLGAAWAMGAFDQNKDTPKTDASVQAIERAVSEQNKTAQTDPRIAALEKQNAEMKSIQEAQLVTNREVLSTLKRLLTVQTSVASSLS